VIRTNVVGVMYMNNLWWSKMTMLFITHIFFHPLNHVQCPSSYYNLQISIKVLSKNPIHLDNSCKCVPKVTMSSSVGHQISSTSAWLMHDVINKTLSHKIDFQLVPHENIMYLHCCVSFKEWKFRHQLWWPTWYNKTFTYYDAIRKLDHFKGRDHLKS
jgi:hypothetical protein